MVSLIRARYINKFKSKIKETVEKRGADGKEGMGKKGKGGQR